MISLFLLQIHRVCSTLFLKRLNCRICWKYHRISLISLLCLFIYYSLLQFYKINYISPFYKINYISVSDCSQIVCEIIYYIFIAFLNFILART